MIIILVVFSVCFFVVISVVKECEYLIEKCYTSRSIGGKLFFYTALSCCIDVGCLCMVTVRTRSTYEPKHDTSEEL